MASAQILTNGKALYAYNGTEWVPLNTAGNLVNSTRWQYTAVGSETSLSGNDDNGESLIYTPGYEQVYLNGVLLARDADYAATTGTTITGLTALTAGYIVEVIAYNNINVGNTYTQAQIDSKVANTFERWVDTLSASATVLSGLDDNSRTLSYTPGLEQVYVNGILLLPSEYTATSGSSIVLSEAAVASDVIQVYALKNFRVPNTYTIAQTDNQFLTKTSASAQYYTQTQIDTLEKGPAFFAHRTGTQSVTAGVTTKVQLNSELFDTHGCFDSTTNYRFTPTVAGYYQFNATLGIFGNNGSQSNVILRKNGSDYSNTLQVVGAGTAARITNSTLAYMNGSTDYMEMFGVGASGTVEFIGGADSTQFSGSLVRRA
jgi:hypothetical protein